MTDQPDQPKNDDGARIAALEAKVHSLELEKRITVIHNIWGAFDGKDKSVDFLEGVAYTLQNYHPPIAKNAAPSVAEVTSTTKMGKHLGAIDEDAIEVAGSEL